MMGMGAALVVAASCAPSAEPPPLVEEVMQSAPGANVVAYFDLKELRRKPATRELADGTMAWREWQSVASRLGLDPLADASRVGAALFVGSCGVTETVLIVSPSESRRTTTGIIRARVAAEAEPRAWRATPAGPCTAVALEYGEIGVTLRPDGLLLFRSTPFEDACSPSQRSEGSGWDPGLQRLAGGALFDAWAGVGAGATPVFAEAWPDGASAVSVTLDGDAVLSQPADDQAP
jgi:hypothetical protein